MLKRWVCDSPSPRSKLPTSEPVCRSRASALGPPQTTSSRQVPRKAMLYVTRQRLPRMRKATDLPSSTPENVVRARQRGGSDTDSATVEPRGAVAGDPGACLITMPGLEPGAATTVTL